MQTSFGPWVWAALTTGADQTRPKELLGPIRRRGRRTLAPAVPSRYRPAPGWRGGCDRPDVPLRTRLTGEAHADNSGKEPACSTELNRITSSRSSSTNVHLLAR